MNETDLSDQASDDDSDFQQLVDRARAGDSDATGRLIERWRDYLLLIANEDLDRDLQAKIGPSDIVQQSMLAAQNKIADFRGSSEIEFRSWVRQILRNSVEDARRRYKGSKARDVKREMRSDDSQLAAPPLIDAHLTPGTEAVKNERAAILQSAMQELPENYRQVIQLRNWDELAFGEIGKRLNCGEDAARKLWYRAVMRLQEVLKHQHPGLQSGSVIRPG